MADHQLQPGLYEALLTGALEKRLASLVVAAVTPELRALADAAFPRGEDDLVRAGNIPANHAQRVRRAC